MTTTNTTTIRNGIDTAQVYGTLDALRTQPELARFEFRATNRWIGGTHSRSTIQGLWGAGQEDTSRDAPFEVDASEPPVLFGDNEAPNPAEFVLHALAGCLTLTIVNVAAARSVTLTEVSSTLEGVLDARGATGVDETRRNGFEAVRVSLSIKGDASPAKLREIVERAKARSVVYDIIANPVAIELQAEVG
ncbi:OsmC family protein [Baekduia soli]|uniref:OsmC family protein n=1 Tax=Baekduia soli TaxID=496014 RepID=A0A5B8U2X9_9ACTN|nr:OsmC family protein [Baekduia soli]QEC47272.1 OsmC family protein [Baekduia soli]